MAHETAVLSAHVEALETLRAVCQFAEEVGAPVRFLDALDAAAQGKPLPDVELLPVSLAECDAVADLQREVDRLRSGDALT